MAQEARAERSRAAFMVAKSWGADNEKKNEANEAVRKGRSVGFLGRGFVGRREKRRRRREKRISGQYGMAKAVVS